MDTVQFHGHKLKAWLYERRHGIPHRTLSIETPIPQTASPIFRPIRLLSIAPDLTWLTAEVQGHDPFIVEKLPLDQQETRILRAIPKPTQ